MSVPGSHSILIHCAGRDRPGINTAFLRQPSIRLSTSAGSADVLGDVRRDVPDLIIEELHDGDAAGTLLCAELKADRQTRNIPVILVVPAGRRGGINGARPDALLLKPVVPRELFEAVSRYVPLPTRRGLRYEVNLRFGFEYDGRTMQAFTRNVSLNGAFIKTDRAIPEGAHLQLRFTIPGDDIEVCCGGLVRQTVDNQPGCRHTRGLGVEFEGISDEELERLESYIVSRGAPRTRFR